MSKYKAILFAPDGGWVTDCHGDTIAEVCEMVADLGSRWIFYPYPLIIRDNDGYTHGNMRIVSMKCSERYWDGENGVIDTTDLVGKSIKTVKKLLLANL